MKLIICSLLVVVLISAKSFGHDAHLLPSELKFLPAVDINKICEGVFFEARPFPDNDQFFIGCVRGGGFILQCFENESFDQNSLRCVYNKAPSTIPIATTNIPEFPGLDGVCNGKFFNFIDHPTDCGKAIFCFEESPIIRECPQGQIFESKSGRCRDGDRETCQFNQETTTNLPGLEDVCNGKDFNFINHPTDCGKAIFCFDQNPIIRECPEGQIFDINTGRCQNGNRETCEFYGYLDGICDGLNFNFVAHPNDCALAIFCFEENPIIRECGAGEIFDLRLERCRAGDRETCTISRKLSGSIRGLLKENAPLLPDSIDMMKFYSGASEQ